MSISIIYLTRKCPRHCSYCAIRDNMVGRQELTKSQWIEAFGILKKMRVDFNLILGNEPWLLGPAIPEIFQSTDVPYALYTSGKKELFEKYKELYFKTGGINNFSIGVDYPVRNDIELDDDSYEKAMDAWNALLWIKQNQPNVVTHATITVHRKNYKYLLDLVQQLSNIQVFININFIHWDKGGFDFFPKKEYLSDLLFTKEAVLELRGILNQILQKPELIQNSEMLKQDFPEMLGMFWHCKGDPYGGPTVDSDGSLRVCGYRKGTRTPKFSIFDLPKKKEEWQEAVYKDAMECPGCSWSCPWMYHHEFDEQKTKNLFLKHNKNE